MTRPPIVGQTLYARNPRSGMTNRIKILRVGKRTVSVQHLHDDGTPFTDADKASGLTSQPPSYFLDTWTLTEWTNIRKHWGLGRDSRRGWKRRRNLGIRVDSDGWGMVD